MNKNNPHIRMRVRKTLKNARLTKQLSGYLKRNYK
jgi:hypothetical protein